ncbi:hypothetical protein GEMRC1_006181 [Eukaryota sp. GEM-RC1]
MASLYSHSINASSASVKRSRSRTQVTPHSLNIKAFRRGNEASFVRSIMLDVSPEALAAIRDILLNNEVVLPIFVVVMKKYLSPSFKDCFLPLELDLALTQLFCEIDVNGDGTLESDEFSAYVASCITTNLQTKLSSQYILSPVIRATGISVSRASIHSVVFIDAPASRLFACLDNSPNIVAWENAPMTQMDPFSDDVSRYLSSRTTVFAAHLAPCTCLCPFSRNAYLSWPWLSGMLSPLFKRLRSFALPPVLSLAPVIDDENECCSVAIGLASGDVFVYSVPALAPLSRLGVLENASPWPVASVYWAFHETKDLDHDTSKDKDISGIPSMSKLNVLPPLRQQSWVFPQKYLSEKQGVPATSLANAPFLKLVIVGFQDGSVLWFDLLSGGVSRGNK